MKKYIKLPLLIVFLIVGTLFTGCNNDEKELANAFIKSQEILSLEAESDYSFNLEAEGLAEEEQLVFDEVAKQINNMSLSLKQKSTTNESQTKAKAEIDANIKLNDMSFDSSIWLDMDMAGENPVFKEIFKLPRMLMSNIPGGEGKDYIVMDFETMDESMAGEMNLDETMALAMSYQKRFKDSFVDYIKDYDFDQPVMKKLDSKKVDNETINYYEIKLDNDSFKDLIEYTTISTLEDDSILPVFGEYMEEIMALSGEEMPEELSLSGDRGQAVDKVREFFKVIEDLVILGEDGITITIGINEEGYFVSEKGKMDFLIDTKQLLNLIDPSGESEMLGETPVFKLTSEYDTKIKNVNKDLEITMPNVNEENSIDYMELIESMVADIQVDQDLLVIIEDELFEFTNEPLLVNDHYLFSTRDLAKALDADIGWDKESKEVTLEKGDYKSTFTDLMIKDNLSYISIRNMAESLGYTLEWDGEYNTMIVYK